MSLDGLRQLEEKIQNLMTRLEKLQRENLELSQRLDETGTQLKHLESECRQYESEREEIKQRIEKLLARFDGIDLAS